MPLEKSFLSLPAFGEGIGDANSQVGVDEELGEVGIEASPQTEGVSFNEERLADSLSDRFEVDSVAFWLAVQLDPSGTDVVEGESDGRCDTCGDEKSKGINEAPLSETGEEALLEVVIRSSDGNVVEDVSPDIDF